MGIRINTNVSSINAQRTLGQSVKSLEGTLSKLSSGSRINSASDDAAGLAISEKLRASIRGMTQADRNANDGVSLIQTAEGGLSETSNILIRLRELSIQSASDTVGDQERAFSDLEFQSLKSEIDRISNATEFNGKKLLNGSAQGYEFQVGINNVENEDRVFYDAKKINSGLAGLGITDSKIMDRTAARDSLSQIDQALTSISGQRAMLGATQNRLISTSNGLQQTKENLSAANSRIRDTDYAAMTAQNAQQNILAASGNAVLVQANNMGNMALKLIG